LTSTGSSVTHFRRRCTAFVAIAATALFHLGCGDGVGLPDEGVPTEIKAFSGNDQTGPAGGALAEPVVVRVTDRSGRPVANQSVAFAPGSGSGSVTPASVTTDNQGKASTAWTLGPAAGPQSLTARAEGGDAPDGLDVALTAHAVSGAATEIQIASGNEQTGAVSSALPDSLVARVIDAGGNPVAGIEVHWSASGGVGSISPEVVITGEDGLAAAERVLGGSSGAESAQATAAGLQGSPLTFIHTAVPATPSRLVKIFGDGQSAPAGFQLADSLVVQLVDQNDNGVGGRAVTWVVGPGEGSVDPVNSVTTPQGFAVTRWTMPAATGDYSIDAVFSGVNPVGFTGHATADVPTKIELVSGDHQSGSVGAQLAAPLRVKVTDANGNPVENVAVTWTANTDGSVGATSTGTDAAGIAEVTRTLGLTPGIYTTTAEVEGLDGSPITFTSTANVGPAAKLAIVTQPSSSGQSGVPLETQPVIQLQDAFGNNVAQSGRAITAGVSGGSVTGGTASTDGTGKATFSSLAIVGSAGLSFAVTFSSGLLLPVTSEPVTLSAGNANKLVFLTTPPATVQAGVVWVQHPVIQLEDAGGNPLAIPDVNIVANISVGAGTLNGTKTVATDENGQAEFTDLEIDGKVGQRTVRFRNSALPASSAITAVVNVVAGPAAKIKANSDVSQNGSIGAPVAEPPSVLVEDEFDNPVAGKSVTFAVTAGGGTIAPPTPVTTGSDGVASLTSWTLGPASGANTVTASATGLTGSPVTFNASVAAINTNTHVSGAPTSSVVGQSVDFTVQVTSGSGTPTGSVTLTVDGVDQPTQALTAGQAVFPVTFTTASPPQHTVLATYPGGGAFGGSSDNLNFTVDEAATSVGLVSDHAGQTPPQGESITFTATVSVTSPGAGAPTGSVQFKDNGADLGAPVALTGGVASLPTDQLLEGAHSITAEYLGDANFAGSTSGAVSQDVGPPPDSGPIGMGETYNTNEDNPLTLDPGGGVLANDSDPDGDPITAVLVSPPQHTSSFSLNSDGSFTYQPAANYNGPDAFTYRVSANGATTGVLTASITVAPVNDPPVASADDAGASLLDATVTQAVPGVLGNDSDVDGDGLTAVLDQDVSHGSLTLNSDGSFSYTPEPGFTGPDSFQYHASDGSAASNTVTVSFLVVLSL
jgi:hypothetical protein